MALSFNNTIDEWQDEGTEPSDSLKKNGFTAGYKPPASIFNWFWNKVTNCIREIQNTFNKVITDIEIYGESDGDGLKVTKGNDSSEIIYFSGTVEKGNTLAVTSQAVYTALQGLAAANIVIASSDTDSILAARANYIIDTDNNAADTINAAILEVADGGKITLLSGTYNCTSAINFFAKNIQLCGCGDSTIINTSSYCSISSSGTLVIKDCAINSTASDFIFVFNTSSASAYKSFNDFKLINCTVDTTTLALFAGVSVATDSYSSTGVYYLIDCIVSGATYLLYKNSGSSSNYGAVYDCVVTGCRFKNDVTFNSDNAALYGSANIGLSE